MAPAGIVLPEQVDGRKYLVCRHGCQGLVAVAVGLEVASHAGEVEMCLQDGSASCPVTADEEVQSGRCIQQATAVHDVAEVLLGHVLVEKEDRGVIYNPVIVSNDYASANIAKSLSNYIENGVVSSLHDDPKLGFNTLAYEAGVGNEDGFGPNDPNSTRNTVFVGYGTVNPKVVEYDNNGNNPIDNADANPRVTNDNKEVVPEKTEPSVDDNKLDDIMGRLPVPEEVKDGVSESFLSQNEPQLDYSLKMKPVENQEDLKAKSDELLGKKSVRQQLKEIAEELKNKSSKEQPDKTKDKKSKKKKKSKNKVEVKKNERTR